MDALTPAGGRLQTRHKTLPRNQAPCPSQLLTRVRARALNGAELGESCDRAGPLITHALYPRGDPAGGWHMSALVHKSDRKTTIKSHATTTPQHTSPQS